MAGAHVSIGADSKKAERELKSFERKTRKIAKSIQKGFQERIGHKLFDGLTGAARAVPGILNDAIKSASDLNEELSKSEVIFKDASSEIESFANGAAESMGLTKTAALQATGTIGNMFTAMGMSGKEAADMSMSMVKLAADLGSFNNTSTDDAIQAIGAALRGESEPIRRYGVLLDDATLKAEALTKGLYDGKGALEPASRALSAYSVILKQTTSAQGDFERTSDGLANSQKIANARIDEAATKLGMALLPAMQKFVDLLNNTDFDAMADGIAGLVDGFASLASTVQDAYGFYKGLIDLMRGNKSVFDGPQIETINANASGIEMLPKGETWASYYRKKEEERQRAQARLLEGADPNDPFGEQAMKANRMADLQKQIEARRKANEDFFSRSERKKKTESKDPASNLIDALRDRLSIVQDSLNQSSSLSGNLAVSSMQRIGGGGGVASTLDIQKRQANLQAEMVELLKQINSAGGMSGGISDF
jgi:hypothetical protein